MYKSKLGIIIDTSSGLTVKEASELGFKLIPIGIIVNSDRALKDEYEITKDTVFNLIKEDSSTIIKTSQPNFIECEEALEEMSNRYEKVVVITISKHLSGSYNQWKILESEKDNLYVVDSEDISIGNIIIAKKIVELFESGLDIDEILSYIEQRKSRRIAFLGTGDINRLIKGGRVSLIKGTIAKLLKISILIRFDGRLEFLDKGKSPEVIMHKANTYMKKNFLSKKETLKSAIFVSYIIDKELETQIIEIVKKEFGIEKIEYIRMANPIGCHTGANSFAVYLEKN